MSKIRPELCAAKPGTASLTYEAGLYRVMEAVRARRTLIHGHLEDGNGRFCAIGCAFDDGVPSLPTALIDEVAIYNDSFPKLNGPQRRKKVLAWLRFRIEMLKGSRRKL